ncbi:MAG TPA: ABC transporter ATPase [Bacteroidia bacterium]|jgi:hypothetical protein|nr:ABC transporter ATPase [Bacteroidia bacterium]
MNTFETIAPTSRIWIYQSRTRLSEPVKAGIREKASRYVSQWKSHGSSVDASFTILHDHFLIMAMDESQTTAGGCSIDTLLQFVQGLEKEFGLSLLNRMILAWEEGGEVKTADMAAFEALLDAGKLNQDTLVFNNLIEHKSDLESGWRIPLRQSWHSRLLKVK